MAKEPTENSAAEEGAEPKKAAAKTTTSKKAAPKIEETPVEKKTEVVAAEETVADVQVADTTVDVAVKEDKKASTKETASAQAEFLSSFNWHNYQEGIDFIEDKQLDEFEKLVKENFVDTADDDVIEGVVVYMTDREAIIDINAKSEGVISLNEFRYNPNLKVGDKVEVIVDMREDRTGQLVLSHRKARVIKAWDRVNNAHDNGEIVSGFVKCRTKGGMIVDVFGIEAFLPGSQIDVKPIRDYDQYVNKTMEFKVVKINHEFKNVVV